MAVGPRLGAQSMIVPTQWFDKEGNPSQPFVQLIQQLILRTGGPQAPTSGGSTGVAALQAEIAALVTDVNAAQSLAVEALLNTGDDVPTVADAAIVDLGGVIAFDDSDVPPVGGGGGGGAAIEPEDGVSTLKISAMTILPNPPTGPVYVPAIQGGFTGTNYQSSVSTLLTGVSLGTTLAGQGITIAAGYGGITSGAGGNLSLLGGSAMGGGGGGYISMTGGNGYGAGQSGGAFYMQAGQASQGPGGSLFFLAGYSTSGVYNGGNVLISSGNSVGGQAGAINLTVGTGGPTANGNGIVLKAGAGGVTSGAGGNLHLYAGLGTPNGYIYMHNLPAANPGLTGAIWRDPITKALSAS